MVKTKAKQHSQTVAVSASQKVAALPAREVLNLDDVVTECSDAKLPRFYDLGPGGRPRVLDGNGTPIVLTLLSTAPETGVWNKYPAYERFVKWRMEKGAQKQPQKKRPQPPKPKYFNLYRVLRVPPNSSSTALRESYRTLLLLTHPDKGGRTEDFNLLKAAYDVLSRAELRQVYDEFGLEGLLEDDPSFDLTKFLRH